MDKKTYLKTLKPLQTELVKLQRWVQLSGQRLIIAFEGRDAAGKGGAIKAINERLNPRHCHIAALGIPTEQERGQWYFQRYAAQFPSAGEITLFDRSWYNRAGVERIMGFCSEEEYQEFLVSCPQFERTLLNSGTLLIKFWLDISFTEQQQRFAERLKNPLKRWKFSDMDLSSQALWAEYSLARDTMLAHTDTEQSPWWIVPSDNKYSARLNIIQHILEQVPYEDIPFPDIQLPTVTAPENGHHKPKHGRLITDHY